MSVRAALASALFAQAVLGLADPMVTPAAQLAPRADDPLLVGYISSSGQYMDVRSCDYTESITTSGSYVRCCPTAGGACPFFTSCSGNTLIAANTAVPCDYEPTLTCNTGLVLPTASAAGGPSYIACWQKTLGNTEFTFVQDIGSATVAPAPTGSSSGSGSGSSSSGSSSSRAGQSSGSGSSTTRSSATSGSSSTTSTPNAAPTAAIAEAGLSGGLIGAVALLAQAIL